MSIETISENPSGISCKSVLLGVSEADNAEI